MKGNCETCRHWETLTSTRENWATVNTPQHTAQIPFTVNRWPWHGATAGTKPAYTRTPPSAASSGKGRRDMATRQQPATDRLHALVAGLGMVAAFAWLALCIVGGVT